MNKLFIILTSASLLSACSLKKEVEKISITKMESPAKSPSGEPYLFTDENGVVYLSWIEGNDDLKEFKFSQLNDNHWSQPMVISSGNNWFVNWADYPMMAANEGEFIAHYLEKSGESTYAYDVKLTSSRDKGKTWKTPAVLHDDGKEAEHGFVSMLPFKKNYFITWLDGRNTAMEGMENRDHHGGHHGAMSLRAAIVDSKGNKIKEWELDSKTCDCCQTSAAITANGPVVVYRDRSDEEIRDMSIVRLVDRQWTEPKTIHSDNWKINGCPVNGPRVVAAGNDLAVAWFSAASDTSQVNVIFSNDGGETFGKAIRVDEGKAIGRVDIVMLDNHHAVVSWMEGTEIKAAKINSDGTKEPSVTVATSSESRSSGFPQMTKSGTKLIFAWTDDKDKTIKVASLTI